MTPYDQTRRSIAARLLPAIRRIATVIGKAWPKLPAWLNTLSCAALAGLMLLVTLNVILRAVFKSPILGTYDLTGFMTVIIIGCGLAFCSIDNGHIEIGYFVDKAGPKVRAWIVQIGRILSFAVLSVYTYALFNMGTRLLKANEVSVTTRTPLYLFIYLLAICFAVFSLTVLAKIFTKNPEGSSDSDT
ncbi:MAG: TRAP transporter small permease [Bacillota bacterium]|nr:TRAP transporter small permease [Bacillota bacterium]